ncbi:unnamed protein product [Ceutorhynchus assimilis]|uniref:Uncharacterized protein n=1 Tax=Ceutorhynchus assimilis TaxID=467358 RepID=A0A9N9MSP6_9CUCU|nr:unnamed protein product [Ceutorhynchus assimilis]
MNPHSRASKILSLAGVSLTGETLEPEPVNIVREINENDVFTEFGPALNDDDVLLQMADEAVENLLRSSENPSIDLPKQLPNFGDETCNPKSQYNEINTLPELLNLESSEDFEEQTVNVDDPADPTYVIPHEEEPNSSDSEGDSEENEALVPRADEGEIQENEGINESKSRRKRRHVNQNEWKKNSEKLKRQSGQQYLGKRKNEGNWDYKIVKKPKSVGDKCKCDKKTTLKCKELTNDDRAKLFDHFWKLTWSEKQIYVTTLINKCPTQRSRNRKQEDQSRRAYSYSYFLNKQSIRLKVCKTMFCNTLNIPKRTVSYWLLEKNIDSTQDIAVQKEINPRQRKINKQKEDLILFLNSLPKLESHYCRKSTSKLYLEPVWTSKLELYRLYKNDWCTENNLLPLSVASFSNMIDDQNIALFSPKKDECDKCVAHKTGNISLEIFEEHQVKKEEARNEKQKDKEAENCNVYTMDLQSVLLSPKSNVSSLYYKTKLIVHNFTVFNLKTKDGYCYIWHEGQGGLTANIFTSILYSFVRNHVMQENEAVSKIIFYSDGCSCQNRNALLSSALLNLSQESKIQIEQKYLEKGHTQMECDSMHSSIERKLKKKIINVPADYVEVCQSARLNPRPYIVNYLDYTFFKNFESMQVLNSIRPGRTTGDAVVTDIRGLRYSPDGSIMFKIRHPEEWKPLPCRLNKNKTVLSYDALPQLYDAPIPIKKEKFQHLMDLKLSLKKDYHAFYDSLSHL